MGYRRVFLIVADSLGIGAAPDAAAFGDEGANTLGSLIATGRLRLPTLCALGLSHIDGVRGLPRPDHPLAAVCRMQEKSAGKDTTVGHFELAGLPCLSPFPTYPEGFPPEVLASFTAATGLEVLCNRPYSGTAVIADYGEEHLKTGKPIVYTSADSVFQIAAHEALIPPEQLYALCRKARALLVPPHGVGRVIARPFVGTPGAFVRTANRRDFSLPPPAPTLLDQLRDWGLEVIGVGKIGDIFAGRGLTESLPTHGNAEGMAVTAALLQRDFHGLAFVNLVDFDMLYGHRQDPIGYAEALNALDCRLAELLPRLGPEDLLILTADHGCDPADAHTDHTREYVPLVVYGKGVHGGSYGTVCGFDNVAGLVSAALEGHTEHTLARRMLFSS